MIQVAAAVIVLLVASSTCAYGQTSAAATDQPYRFIDRTSAIKAISSTRELLTEAGNQGYAVMFSRSAGSLGTLLRRDGAGPRAYRVLSPGKDDELLKNLNEGGAEGFRLVPAAAKIFVKGYSVNWIAVLAPQVNGARYTYSMVKGDNEIAMRGIADAMRRGATLVAVLGAEKHKPSLIFEEAQPGALVSSAASVARDYRIVSTFKTPTLETEIKQAATEGFRAIGTGYMTVIMEREPGSPATPVDYRVVAVTRVATAERELQAAAVEGFRIAVVPDSVGEGVFVLQRTPGKAERFEYAIARLDEKGANELLLRAEASGYRIAFLLNELVVFERAK